MRRAKRLRVEYLAPLAVAASAICVGASELMRMFVFKNGDQVLKVIDASDRHHYALLVLAVCAILLLVLAMLTGSRPAATGVAIAGGIALLIFLTVDLPDVNQQGSLEDPSFEFFASKAEPAAGFWFALVGTVGLALSGGVLASLRSEQLRRPLDEIRDRGAGGSPRPAAAPSESVPGDEVIGEEKPPPERERAP